MLHLLLILLIPFSGAYFGRPLNVENVRYQKLSEGVSCKLLQHRKLEREKILRERYYLDEILDNQSLKSLIFKNQFLSNQYFIDSSLWDDDLIEVHFQVNITDDLAETISNHGIDQVFFSARGTGFHWSSFSANFPEGFEINQIDEELLDVRYLIYRGDYCHLELKEPELSWLGPEEDMGERFDSFKAIENLML